MGFEPTINQRLLPPTFPRFIKIQSFDLTVENLTQFLTQLNEAIKITELKSYHQIFEFALNYSTINQSVLLRSYLQVLNKIFLIELEKIEIKFRVSLKHSNNFNFISICFIIINFKKINI